MRVNWKSFALLVAGALLSVIMGASFARTRLSWAWLAFGGAAGLAFLLYGSNALWWIWHELNLWRRRSKFLALKVGILNDMGWDFENEEIYSQTDVSPKKWKDKLETLARDSQARINVQFMDTRKNFDSYNAIVNPYGAVYPEHDLKSFATVQKVLEYVKDGGLFVNVADIPSYFAYNPWLQRRLDATPPTYDRTLTARRLFARTPLMQELGLTIKNSERTPLFTWPADLEGEFGRMIEDVGKLKVHRVAVVERNLEAVIKPRQQDSGGLVTPVFLVKYGEGTFLISLVFLKDNPENQKVKQLLPAIILELIARKKKQEKANGHGKDR